MIPVIIQTCDRYEKFWDGLFRFMAKHWDPSIDCTIYFCNEESSVSLPRGWKHLTTGKGSFVENLRTILAKVGEEHVFYMLEDFWPTAPMRKDMFVGLHNFFKETGADAVQVSSYLPYFSLETTTINSMFKFKKDSDWIFNLQARFWKSESFLKPLTEPKISESEVGSAITAEIASDRKARESGNLLAYLYHYSWYPISGVSYRGEFTDIGKQMLNTAAIDKMVEDMFSQQHAWSDDHRPLSNLS